MSKGAPTKYDEKYNEQAYKLCAKHGYNDKTLSDFFNISASTLYNWKNEHPHFLESIKGGKDEFDTDQVENALLRRALGTKVEESRSDKDGETHTTKEIPPDPTSIIFWLHNRRRDRWRKGQDINLDIQKVSLIDLTGEDANTN